MEIFVLLHCYIEISVIGKESFVADKLAYQQIGFISLLNWF